MMDRKMVQRKMKIPEAVGPVVTNIFFRHSALSSGLRHSSATPSGLTGSVSTDGELKT
jgi:hypothetical protein